MVTAPARRELVRWMVTRELSEPRAQAVVGMSASALRYETQPDQTVALRARIVALAQRHRGPTRSGSWTSCLIASRPVARSRSW